MIGATPTDLRVVGGARIVSSWTEADDSDNRYQGDTVADELSNQQREKGRLPPPLLASHLVLHFDINETILVGDEIGGDGREDCLNKMIAKSAFCMLPPDFLCQQQQQQRHSNNNDDNDIDSTASTIFSRQDIPQQEYQKLVPTHWWDGTPIQQPETKSPNEDESRAHHYQHIPPLYTGWEWPPGTCPYYRTSLKPRAQEFIKTDGEMYRELYNELNRRLDDVLPGDGNNGRKNGVLEDDTHGSRYQEIMQSMIPAFFQTLMALSARRTQAPFTIVIRTFGMDLPDVAKAISDFAQGRHPAYPDFHDPTLVLTEQHLFRGSWAVADTHKSITDLVVGAREHVFQLWQGDKLVAAGDEQALELIHSCTICGIQDDYWFWKRNQYQPSAGKPVWALALPSLQEREQEENEQIKNGYPYYHHILLDDNVHNLHDDSVACVRQEQLQRDDGHYGRRNSSSSFRTLTGKEIKTQHGLHIVRVPTIEPILNPKWFLEQIDKARHQLFLKFKANSKAT